MYAGHSHSLPAVLLAAAICACQTRSLEPATRPIGPPYVLRPQWDERPTTAIGSLEPDTVVGAIDGVEVEFRTAKRFLGEPFSEALGAERLRGSVHRALEAQGLLLDAEALGLDDLPQLTDLAAYDVERDLERRVFDAYVEKYGDVAVAEMEDSGGNEHAVRVSPGSTEGLRAWAHAELENRRRYVDFVDYKAGTPVPEGQRSSSIPTPTLARTEWVAGPMPALTFDLLDTPCETIPQGFSCKTSGTVTTLSGVFLARSPQGGTWTVFHGPPGDMVTESLSFGDAKVIKYAVTNGGHDYCCQGPARARVMGVDCADCTLVEVMVGDDQRAAFPLPSHAYRMFTGRLKFRATTWSETRPCRTSWQTSAMVTGVRRDADGGTVDVATWSSGNPGVTRLLSMKYGTALEYHPYGEGVGPCCRLPGCDRCPDVCTCQTTCEWQLTCDRRDLCEVLARAPNGVDREDTRVDPDGDCPTGATAYVREWGDKTARWCSWKGGAMHGRWIASAGGKPRAWGAYSRGIPDGVWGTAYGTGAKAAEWTFEDGHRHGALTSWDRDGARKEFGRYDRSRKVGEWARLEGRLVTVRETYRADRLDGPFTEYAPSGGIKKRGEYRRGERVELPHVE